MAKKKLSKYEEEMIKDAERIEAEIEKDPKIRDMKAPLIARERLFKAIQKMEAAEQKRLTDEEEELIELGKTYKKRKKTMNGLVVVTAATLVMTMGITSVGGAEKIFNLFKRDTLGREQTQVNSSESVVEELDWSEDKAYQEIEEKYGFTPVRMMYLPPKVVFQEPTIYDELQGINLIYGQDDEINIIYWIRPNYRESSWSKDVEDELLEEYEIELENTSVQVEKYLVENENIRWLIQFEYEDANYSLYILNMDKEEVEKIINSLYFF